MQAKWQVSLLTLSVSLSAVPVWAQAPQGAGPVHNLVIFVPDGLRSGIVTEQSAPNLANLRAAGVDFRNSHSLFPTFTMPNASAIATGHYFGDTGDLGNTIYTAFPVRGAGGSVTPFIEQDAILDEIDDHFGGNFVNEEAILSAARRVGYSTAAVGKLGPAKMQDLTDRGSTTFIVDDATGRENGVPLPPDFIAALQRAGLATQTPSRGENGKGGDAKTPGTTVPNSVQQQWMADVTTQVILPQFKTAGKPFVLVFWSRDPDGTQHFQGDSHLKLEPGINGPTSMAAIRNADNNLGQIRSALRDLELEESTNIIVTADHGFSTISKQSGTSWAAKATYSDVPEGLLPPGFAAVDLAHALELPLFDPDKHNSPVNAAQGQHAARGNGLIGQTPDEPDVVVAANGGADLIYLPRSNASEVAPRVVAALLEQDYVSGIFVDDALGSIPGTLPLSLINLKGTALTPVPAIVVNFRSFDTGCGTPALCAVEVADTPYQQGQGMHGGFGRGDTHNFTAAFGPDFKTHFVDPAPVSNADMGMTAAKLAGLPISHRGKLLGRVVDEALAAGGEAPGFEARSIRSEAAANGLATVLEFQTVGATRYFDAAGFVGRTVGLSAP